MLHHYTSPFLQFSLNPKTCTWSLHDTQGEGPFLEDVWFQVVYRVGRGPRRATRSLTRWTWESVDEISLPNTPHGALRGFALTAHPDEHGLQIRLEFTLCETYPLFLWRIHLTNRGAKPLYLQRVELLRAGFFPSRRVLPDPSTLTARYHSKPAGHGVVRPHPKPGELAFFSNGWQSWSFSGTYGPRQRYRHTRLGFFTAPMWFNPGSPRPRRPGHFVSEMFGVLGDRHHRQGILIGFLSQKQHFGTLEAYIGDSLYPAVNLWLDGDDVRLGPETTMHSDWAVIQPVNLDDAEPLAAYLQAVAREHNLQDDHLLPEAGWCSWYHFFQDIDEHKIRGNLQAAVETQQQVPLNLIQIDDGYEAQVGDWFAFSRGFPQGVAPLAREIRSAGFTPGLWLAPFIVHPRAEVALRHRDWLLRNRWGLPVNAGFVWNVFTHALDLTHPEALDYACKAVHTAAHEWGYPYLKLDFLYAAALRGRYRDRTRTRAQVLRGALEALRQAAGPKTTLLGCGCPLGSAIGLMDAMRISADVAPHWEPRFTPPQALFRKEWNMPAARNALQNTLTRAMLHKRWWVNDPDCLLLRPESDLTLAEVQSLATAIALSGGALLLSDDLPRLPPERLRIAAQLLPLIGKRPHVTDWFDRTQPRLLRLDLNGATGAWHLVAIFNWDDHPIEQPLPLAELRLEETTWIGREFWSGAIIRAEPEHIPLIHIPRHGVALFALRPYRPQPQYLGSDLHISQGLEVTRWEVSTEKIYLELQRPGEAQGAILLHLPTRPGQAFINEQPLACEHIQSNIFRYEITLERKASLEINLQNG